MAPGEQQPEVDHRFQSEDSAREVFCDTPFRYAKAPGWFNYGLDVDAKGSLAVLVRYWGQENAPRTFDFLVNGNRSATENISGKLNRQEFVDVQYPLPAEWVNGKKRITLRFQGHAGHVAGAVYDLRIPE